MSFGLTEPLFNFYEKEGYEGWLEVGWLEVGCPELGCPEVGCPETGRIGAGCA